VSTDVDVEARLRVILKSHDRIGFGRRGVLDAEPEIRRFAAALSKDDLAHLCQLIMTWIDKAEAERLAMPLHYNLPEHVQELAIRLCASIPIPDSLPLLRRLQAEERFTADEERMCRDVLGESIAVLSTGAHDKLASE
jgi:hypothetical protein